MTVYLVTYDLNEETNRPNITATVETYGAWAMLSESSYAIVSYDDADDVYTNFNKHLDDNDTLYVIELGPNFAGQGTDDVNEWLVRQLNG